MFLDGCALMRMRVWIGKMDEVKMQMCDEARGSIGNVETGAMS